MTQMREKAMFFSGLTDAEAKESANRHGKNILSRQKGKSFFRQFLSNLNDPVIRILLIALAVNLLLLFQGGDWMETLGIGIAVFLATLISTTSEYGSAKAFERLSEASAGEMCRVRRTGRLREIAIGEIAVGDVVLLSSGDRIPADGFLISGNLTCDQSALTGEGKEIEKHPDLLHSNDPAAPASLFRGCTVTCGSGIMQVSAVGDHTVLGEISREIQQDVRESPLKVRLTKLAGQISKLGYAAAILVAVIYLLNGFVLDSGMRWELIRLKLCDRVYLLEHLLHAFTLGLTVLVVAVPEGLPMMIAVVLSANIRRMVRDQVLVRKPVGIEAAGSMNILFTDKTGTLTEGKMKITSYLPGIGPPVPFAKLLEDGGILRDLTILAFRLGGDTAPGTDSMGKTVALGGSATERALLEGVINCPLPGDYRIRTRLPFDSTRKYSAVSLCGKKNLTLLLGAPEKLIPRITTVLCQDGSTHPFDRKKTEKDLAQLTSDGNRVLGLAISNENIDAPSHSTDIQGSLTFVGAYCLNDPLRREAGKSVSTLQDAGIHVVMITGDNRNTAASIALRCGILNRTNHVVLTGEELSHLSDMLVCELLPRLAVVARALPTDKSRLVRLAQESGLVAGMTGDGINDAPALRRADVGFAMGSGTQVAKDAGDILILDNNLASIVRAVLYGRNIFKSIRKFITLQLTMNFCAVGITVICPFLGVDSPVTVVQMLWINVIMDTLGGLAFAGEPALPSCMREPPKRREEPILNRYMANEIALLGSFTVLLCLAFLKMPRITSVFRPHGDNLYLLTAFFALFIFSSVFNCFNARTDRLNLFAGSRKNPIFWLIMACILIIQLLFVYVGGSVLRTAPLTLRELLVTMGLSLSVFPAELLRKLLWRMRGKRGGY